MKNEKILITGGAGFIANKLIERLIDKNEITIFDNFSRDTFSKSSLSTNPDIKVIHGDVLDRDAVDDAVAGKTVVIHAAGIAGIDTVIKNPVTTMEVNMIGTANVLASSQRTGLVKRLIDFSTSEVFGSNAFRSSEKSETVAGSAGEARWVYSVSKLAGEHLAHAYYSQYNLPIVTVRPFNVYGPGQTGEGALRIFIKKALMNDTLKIDGDGSQIRAWCYVDDFVECVYRCLTAENVVGKSINIGNSRAVTTILGLANIVIRVLESKSKIIHMPPLSADIAIRVPDTSLASEILKFKAYVDLDEGIVRTAKWISENEH